jgi:hypothetical protein
MYESLSAKDAAKFGLLPPIEGILNRGLPVVVSDAQSFELPLTGISLVYKISDHDMVVDTVVVVDGTPEINVCASAVDADSVTTALELALESIATCNAVIAVEF